MVRLKASLLGLGMTVVLFAGASRSAADEAIYQKTARSTVMFLQDGRAVGTGVLVDVKHRIVATAEHVIADCKDGKVEVVFADVADGEIVADFKHYARNLKERTIVGKVLRSNSLKDVAMVQLERLPEGVQAIALAQKPVRAGSQVHVVGNSDAYEGMVFSYCRGYVRSGPAGIRGMMIHHTPTNPGDSGGPVVNSKGELVGLVSGGTTGMSVAQVRYLAYRLYQDLQNNRRVAVANPGRTSQVRDEATGLESIRTMLNEVLGKDLAAK